MEISEISLSEQILQEDICRHGTTTPNRITMEMELNNEMLNILREVREAVSSRESSSRY